ncbi:coagulation factor X [Salminus brasiliensis]|uniref:coagulation factor X n=1 Tax=Salminus brasiliensis TaxID=930266 RepID=UPI003B8397DC
MKTQTLLVLLACFCHEISGAVFLRKANANAVLQRPKRANSGFLEEVKQGSIERECMEEVCDYEEAREALENDQATKAFWLTYHAREPCLTNPCKNNGTCIYLDNSYICQCLEGFEGKYCQEVFQDTLKCLYLNGGCEQFCDGSGPKRKCSCASGYALGVDGKSCIAQVKYPCGKAPLQMNQTVLPRAVSGYQCPKGHCPWQVLLDDKGESLCGGVLVDANWVITAAHCVDKRDITHLKVIAGDHNIDIMDSTEQALPVTHVIIHEKYDPVSMDSDLALLRLRDPATFSAHVVPICLPTYQFAEMELAAVRFHTVSGWGQRTEGGNVRDSPKGPVSPVLRKLAVPLLPKPLCELKSGVNITDNMFCAGYFEGRQESCRGDDGSPLVTQYGETTYLTGIVSWGKGCSQPGFYGIYTKVSSFLDWIQQGMSTPTDQIVTLSKSLNASVTAAPPLEQVIKLAMFCVLKSFFFLLLVHCATSEVFLQNKDANQVFTRHRRANSMFEEFKKGDMERECREERCSYEEAREIFENKEKTDEFWNVYYDGDACTSQPCLNNGVCKDGIDKYVCYCPEMFQGYNCEIDIPQLCENKNGACEHFCTVERNTAVCSCAKGYKLAADGKSCNSDDLFKCGQVHPKKSRSNLIHHIVENITDTSNGSGHTDSTDTSSKDSVKTTTKKTASNSTHSDSLFGLDDYELITPVPEEPVLPEVAGDIRIVNGEDCLPGDCPWQALLVNEDKIGFCGGTILNTYFILSAAHCMNQSRSITVVLGEFDTLNREGHEVTHAVDQVLVHMNYVPETYHNDIALIKLVKPITFTKYILPACLPERDFAERVLMQQEDGMVSGFGRVFEGGPQSTILQKLTVPFIDRATCMESTKFKISNRMFCAGYDQETKDACQGDSGGPHVTKYKNTWFVTGVVSWGEGCARKGKYGVYTQVSKYIKWIESVMERVMPKKGASGKAREKRQTLGYTPVIRM